MCHKWNLPTARFDTRICFLGMASFITRRLGLVSMLTSDGLRTFGERFILKISVNVVVALLCRYKSSPEEVAASCDVTFAMLADPESAVRMFHFKNIACTSMLVMATDYQFLSGGCCLWEAWCCKWNWSRKRVLFPCVPSWEGY